MKKVFKVCLSILITTTALVSCVTTHSDNNRQFRRDSGALVNSALEYANARYNEEALGKLDEAIKLPDLNPYEKSTIYQMIGQYNYDLGRSDRSITAFQNAIDEDGLLQNEKGNIEVVIAQLLIVEERYREGAERLEHFLASGGTEKPQYVELLTSAWVQAEDYEKALPWAKRWHNEANPKDRKHFDMLNFIYSQLDRSDNQLLIIEEMISLWPDDINLWLQKASILSNVGQEKKAYFVNVEMYERGLLKSEPDIRKLLYYHDYYSAISNAASLLEREMKSGILEEDVGSLVLLSLYNRDLGKINLSQSAFNKAIEISGEDRATSRRRSYESNKSKHGGYLTRPIRISTITPKPGDPGFNLSQTTRNRGNFKIAVSDRDAQPLVRVPPITPETATLPGHCYIRFDVSPQGQPFNISALSCSDKIFKTPAIQSVSKWKYNPKIVDGEFVSRSGVESKISFQVK